MRKRTLTALAIAAGAATHAPTRADAFCGFYVSAGEGALYNNATQVVLMRAGTRTVLSMQNNYQGPTEDFAMVVPVPVVLEEKNVKTLPPEVFAKVDSLDSPRLVEYWEQDPCAPVEREERGHYAMGARASAPSAVPDAKGDDLGVTIEAKFAVAEYQVLILSATDSTGLDTWLKQEHYKIPDGAEPFLKPYVTGGWKFFVAKVDASKVKFEHGQAMLSPLRFHYDSEEFNLPIRLGMMNSAGAQDLIVHILSPGQRYELANYANVTIPTNLDVKDETRERFGEFYAALFDRTVAKNPGAVVTEYAWDASSCDPCPTPPLDGSELATLGADVLFAAADGTPSTVKVGAAASKPAAGGKDAVDELLAQPSVTSPRGRGYGGYGGGFVLSRLHLRYAKGGAGEDLVFKAAGPIVGGRELRGADGALEQRSEAASTNNFQGRYAIRHAWSGKIACANPVRGVWGGPPDGSQPHPQPARDLAFVARGQADLGKLVRQDVPEIAVVAGDSTLAAGGAGKPAPAGRSAEGPTRYPVKTSKGCAAGGSGGVAGGVLLLALALAARRRDDRTRRGEDDA